MPSDYYRVYVYQVGVDSSSCFPFWSADKQTGRQMQLNALPMLAATQPAW